VAKIGLINPAQVPIDLLDEIVLSARMPSGSLWLVVGDETLSPEYQALTVPRYLVPNAASVYGLEAYLDEEWECGILIGHESAVGYSAHPEYFAWLLGHELGHARTALADPALAIYEELIVRYLRKASGRSQWRWDELPHESLYDRFGKGVAESVFGPDEVRVALEGMLARGFCDDAPRIEKVLSLQPVRSLDGLREALADFTRPWRSRFLHLWKAESVHQGSGAARIDDLDWLWWGTT